MAASNSTPFDGFKVIGTRPVRHDGVEKVTGRAKYGADYALPGMLHGKVLRSPHAHARIKSINCEQALAMPGVFAVITGADFPEPTTEMVAIVGEYKINARHLSYNVMARDRVLYDGHAVAAVAANSPHVAEEALRLIDVEYEVLPPVMTLDDALKPDAYILFPEMREQRLASRTDPGTVANPERPTNIAAHITLERGDIKAGFDAADFIVEREFKTSAVHQGYIEPLNALAIYSQDGHTTIYCSTQAQFRVRRLTAVLLGLEEGSIKVVPAEIGGGFGGKTTVYLEPLAVLLSRKTGRPVKMVMTRAEVLRASGPTSGTKIKARIGATREGRLTAAEVWMAFEAGAFPGSPFAGAAMTTMASYNFENLKIDSFDVVLNRPKVAAYRAPGAPSSAFACESAIDELAEKCGIDPLDFRIMNGAHEGTQQPAGPRFKRIGFIETCEALKNSGHYRSKLDRKYCGRGVAAGFWFNGGNQSSATVNIHDDGSVSVVTGSVDIGGSRAVMAMIAAEVLGCDVKDVRPLVGDTDSIGFTDGTGGSRVAVATGLAVYEAAHDALRQLKQRAARVWRSRSEEIDFSNGIFSANSGGPAADAQATRGHAWPHRRSDRGARIARRQRRGRKRVRGRMRRRRGRSRYRQGAGVALHYCSGCRPGASSKLRRGAGAGRTCPGDRVGAERRVCVRRQGRDAQRGAARLPDANLSGSAPDRSHHGRGAESQPSAWSPWGRRNSYRAADGGRGQCDI